MNLHTIFPSLTGCHKPSYLVILVVCILSFVVGFRLEFSFNWVCVCDVFQARARSHLCKKRQ